MTEHPILITWLNDYVFCPKSIYFHLLYGDPDRVSFQDVSQIDGAKAHEAIDTGTHSTRSNVLCGLSVYSERYGLVGRIDRYDMKSGELTERKKRIKTVYDGYVFQLYGQYFSLKEMGYEVRRLCLYSMDDNKKYPVPLPEDAPCMLEKFENVLHGLQSVSITDFKQSVAQKCYKCIYEPLCDSSLAGRLEQK